ncbi:hypothetical protein SAMN05216232_0777 [Virgibacillus subterraneus]|uniref:Sulfotransferase family protein n=1 Tax=Virgibacillus subterraneus TaxID=621109 RepID=A0A1H9AEM0_9BACI|nr:hypothetical protein [Virgibacillus subterraneus]SEP75176.1 hypothetical protein SAMN05216232_0777 [Virgibacillus subterraneus]
MALFNKFTRKPQQTKNKAVTILGSGRCGTSMASRSINLMGVDLGEGFVKPNKTNPKGFWENKKIVDVHKEIKNVLGSMPFRRGWQDLGKIKPLKEKMESIVQEQFSDKPLWGWKDPRTSECIEMWKEILADMDVEGNYLVMIRNPVDVAASFRRAYNRNEKAALKQWQIRTLVALRGTRNENRIIVDYDDFIEDSFSTVKNIAKTFNVTLPSDKNELKQELDSFIDPTLRHSRTGLKKLSKSKEIEEDMKELYRICLKAAHSKEYLNSKKFQKQIDNLYVSFLKSHF